MNTVNIVVLIFTASKLSKKWSYSPMMRMLLLQYSPQENAVLCGKERNFCISVAAEDNFPV